MHRDLDKTLVVPIFGAEECIRMQDLVLKIMKYTKKNSEDRDTWTPAAEEETFVRPPLPCPPARCWCPSASSRLATALIWLMFPS